jgi:hypothetical protein
MRPTISAQQRQRQHACAATRQQQPAPSSATRPTPASTPPINPTPPPRPSGYSFLLYDDSALLFLYCQAAAALGLVAPLYLLILQEPLGGLANTMAYGLRATGGASAFLALVHFIAAATPPPTGGARALGPARRGPAAPVHAQHALSLLWTTHQARRLAGQGEAARGSAPGKAKDPAATAPRPRAARVRR